MEAAWGKDDERAIQALEENMILDPGYRETRPKLYSLLIIKADRLLEAGERDAAFEVLMRALTSCRTAARRRSGWRPTRQPPRPPADAGAAAPPTAAPATKPSSGSSTSAARQQAGHTRRQ